MTARNRYIRGKEITSLTKKQTPSGDEPLPVSAEEYITPKQITAGVEKGLEKLAEEDLSIRRDFAEADAAERTARTQGDADTLHAAQEAISAAVNTEKSERESGDRATLSDAKKYAEDIVARLVDSSPEALDTLQELAEALGNDPNFATTVMDAIGRKSDSNHQHDDRYIQLNSSCNKEWKWEGKEGQPTWVWGGEDSVNMFVYNPGNFRVSHASTCDSADALDGIHAAGFARAYGDSVSFGGDSASMTTAEFVTMLEGFGAFIHPYWIARGSWSYAGNRVISDTGIGNIQLAGSVVEVAGHRGNYTIRITTPSTGGGELRRVFIYINNGNDYAPGWFKLANAHEVVTTEATQGERGLMSASDKTKLDEILSKVQSAWEYVNVGVEAIEVSGGKSYYFSGSNLSVTGYFQNFPPSADSCIIAVKGDVTVTFSGFMMNENVATATGASSQWKVYVIQRIPVSNNGSILAVTCGIYG